MSTLRSWAKQIQPHMQKQWFTTAQKQTPSKDRFHQPIPSDHFPKGFRLTGLHAGIKKKNSQLDLAVLLSDSPRERTASAACFTQNAFRAAPVIVCEGILAENKHARGLVVNSGCANAVTGKQGLDDAWAMSSATDALLQTNGKGTKESLVMSTGVIGHHLPLKSILSGIEKAKNSLASDFAAWERAARAFMTTDTFPKLRARTFSIDGVPVRIAGMDKGAGMIHPRMGPPSGSLHATLLAFVGTDAYITPDALQEAVNHAVSRSFNSVSVDGDMSTNDTLIAIANGASDMQNAIERDTPAFSVFQTELTDFCGELARLIVRDGEGATKFVTLTVKGASTFEDAHRIASTVSTSLLVKTALYGEDANWGRLLASAGSLSDTLTTPIDTTKVSVTFVPSAECEDSTPLRLLVQGEPLAFDEARAKSVLSVEDINIDIELGLGNVTATYWTCDLSHEYVSINGDYRS